MRQSTATIEPHQVTDFVVNIGIAEGQIGDE